MGTSTSIVNKIYNTFDKTRFNCEVHYQGNVIEVTSKRLNGKTRIWIRLGYSRRGYTVNISSIELSTTYRRKGMFTRMMKDIASLDEVECLMVGGVCTVAMKNWCLKNGFVDINNTFDYVLLDKSRLLNA